MAIPGYSRATGRRGFLKAVLAAGAAPLVVPSRLLGTDAPSKQITLGCIGLGPQGTRMNLASFLALKECRVLAVCDVMRERMESAAAQTDQTYQDTACRRVDDFREVLADPALDAVVISTPDHWHVPMSLMALQAGKHVFCEKPTYTIGEGRQLADAVRRSGKIFQTGLEDRSVEHYHKLVEWQRNGAIGDLQHAEVTLPQGSIHPYEDEAPVPEGFNWQMWLGPAPWHAYTPTRTQSMHWRYIRDYSTGMLTDWGTHLVDTAQLAVNDPEVCPVEVKGTCENVPEKSQSDIPAIFEVHYKYGNGITVRVKTVDQKGGLVDGAAIRLVGSMGWVEVNGWRGQIGASDPQILRTKYAPGESKHWPRPPSEQRNFLDCLRSGKETTYTADTLHKLCTTLHMGLISMDLGRKLQWDPKRERFVNDDEANARIARQPARDWVKA
jgi:predicted dehydrogenase